VAALPIAIEAQASQEEDAELKRLWAEWTVKEGRLQEAYTAHKEALEAHESDKAEIPAPWLYKCMTESNYPGASFAIVERRQLSWMHPSNPGEQRITPIKAKRTAKLIKAVDECKERSAKASVKYKRDCTALRKRHRIDELEGAESKAWSSLQRTEIKIYNAPAEGIAGIAIKLHIWSRWNFSKPLFGVEALRHEGRTLKPLCAEAQQLAGLDLDASSNGERLS